MKNDKPIIVVAVGGNALLQRGEQMSYENQANNIDIASAALAKLSEDYKVVIVHGNGPQVGLLALQNLAYTDAPPYPLDVLGAETQGMIGYMMMQGLRKYMPSRKVSTIVTQISVDKNDPAFRDPNKFIGPVYDKETALAKSTQYGWQIKPDGEYWRRVVASPFPKGIVEIDSIRTLLNAGHTVICCGGGGCPVIDNEGEINGVEAVIDKDFSAATLAKQLSAEHFLILTDGEYVCVDWGKPTEQPLYDVSVDQIQQYTFAAGSMAPKVAACCDFASHTSGIGHIGSLHKASEIMASRSGTHIHG
ncbi:carbamate kinase [Photobacterium gaetbulicola]|uniref:Carbamate kinase n=1 Tax=Photobacterium gaetbulicola Gung47 TaxID=658445 RepID=A0A0C5WGG2_9GAMM|nr:carbamate kinase [Photobacterium gaetbulicola]AJR05282.1 carbamate kinase [Photobacterium gaetbulicola Gung47]PSU02594.1 carbamate kinase [Photobacterium gaetbulicola]